jgi:hypothetical protein
MIISLYNYNFEFLNNHTCGECKYYDYWNDYEVAYCTQTGNIEQINADDTRCALFFPVARYCGLLKEVEDK